MAVKNKVGKSVVPCAVLRPLVEAWLSRAGYVAEERYKTDFASGLDVLAQETGIARRRLWHIMNVDENVTFDTADKLLCMMGMNSEWHSSLAEFYGPLEVAPYERHFVDGLRAVA